jgi:hypothetical protein
MNRRISKSANQQMGEWRITHHASRFTFHVSRIPCQARNLEAEMGVAAGACPERSRRMGDRPADHDLGGIYPVLQSCTHLEHLRLRLH